MRERELAGTACLGDALTSFAAHGTSATTLRAVAAAAGVSLGLVQHHGGHQRAGPRSRHVEPAHAHRQASARAADHAPSASTVGAIRELMLREGLFRQPGNESVFEPRRRKSSRPFAGNPFAVTARRLAAELGERPGERAEAVEADGGRRSPGPTGRARPAAPSPAASGRAAGRSARRCRGSSRTVGAACARRPRRPG